MDHQQKLVVRMKRVIAFNKTRIDRAIALLPKEKQPLFHVIPFLLHVNHPEFPGYVDDPSTPHGIANYAFKPELKSALISVFPDKVGLIEDIRSVWPKKRSLESILLMGSIGSIAQSEKSDFDYWACYDGRKVSSSLLHALQEKITAVEQWCEKEYNLEVHFFPSDIEMVRKNDFGEASGESAGSAQATFLKAEFYATNIMVAGKMPFWWFTPASGDDEYYRKLYRFVQKLEKPDPRYFMDLGNLEQLVPHEMFGAAIWQISKAMDSPFKSVLKMAKLEVFLANMEAQKPLCSILKNRVHIGKKSDHPERYLDPYAAMFDQLVEYYNKIDKQDVVKLVQTCLYIKCECALSTSEATDSWNFKQIIVQEYVNKWGWSQEKLEKLDSIKDWDFQEVSDLGQKIHAFLIGCYRRLSAKIQQQEQLVSDQDATVIGRKIDSFYTKKDNKIVYLKRAFEEGLYVDEMSIVATMDLKSAGKKSWTAYRGDVLDWKDHEREGLYLKNSDDPVDLVLWCVFNRIIDDKTKIYLSHTAEPLTMEDILGFVEQAMAMFPPIKISDLPRKSLLAPARILRCLIVVNFESWRNNASLETVRTVYSTSWGELYSVSGFDALAALEPDLDGAIDLQEIFLLTPSGQDKNHLYDEFIEKTQMDYVQFL